MEGTGVNLSRWWVDRLATMVFSLIITTGAYAAPKKAAKQVDKQTTRAAAIDIIFEKKAATTATLAEKTRSEETVEAIARRRALEFEAEYQASLKQQEKEAFEERGRQLEEKQQALRDRIEANRRAVQRRDNGDGDWDQNRYR